MAEVAVLLWCTQSHNTDHFQSKRNSSLLELLERDTGRGSGTERWRLKDEWDIMTHDHAFRYKFIQLMYMLQKEPNVALYTRTCTH